MISRSASSASAAIHGVELKAYSTATSTSTSATRALGVRLLLLHNHRLNLLLRNQLHHPLRKKMMKRRQRRDELVVEQRPKRVKELEKAANFRGMKKPIGRERRGGRFPATDTNLANVFNELDDNFLKASESAHEVMLEATRLHYHSNFADNRGHIDHSAIVMRVITWNRAFPGLPNNVDIGKDDFETVNKNFHDFV